MLNIARLDGHNQHSKFVKAFFESLREKKGERQRKDTLMHIVV